MSFQFHTNTPEVHIKSKNESGSFGSPHLVRFQSKNNPSEARFIICIPYVDIIGDEIWLTWVDVYGNVYFPDDYEVANGWELVDKIAGSDLELFGITPPTTKAWKNKRIGL